MIKKNFFSGGIVVAVMILFFLSGCQTAGGLLAPKKKVPPYEDLGKAVPVPPAPATAEDMKAGESWPGMPAESWLDPAVLAGMADYVSARITQYRDKQSQWQGLAASFSLHDLALPQPEKWWECTGTL
ncbi:MAG: hypothetical protein MUO63_21560, partial [Desulfobulbaceae bacterium]|nr:hypothetical protein [Desulfobulbaceae bacterium]